MSAIADEMRKLADTQTDPSVRKILRWAAIELDDRANTIADLDVEIKEYSDGYAKMTAALHAAKQQIEAVSAGIHTVLWTPYPTDVDLAPFKNLMPAHGVEPYAKTKRIKKVKA